MLGQFPELCYSSLLQPFVDKTGMAVPGHGGIARCLGIGAGDVTSTADEAKRICTCR